MTAPTQWPPRDQIITDLIETAVDYAGCQTNLAHPEDIACALTTAIDVAWRMVKPL